MKRLIPNMGACIATNHSVVDGMKVGCMYRETLEGVDSGWRFFSRRIMPLIPEGSQKIARGKLAKRVPPLEPRINPNPLKGAS